MRARVSAGWVNEEDLRSEEAETGEAAADQTA
jgi:hypothetical protein